MNISGGSVLSKTILNINEISVDNIRFLFGPQDLYLKTVEDVFECKISFVDGVITVEKVEVSTIMALKRVFNDILKLIDSKKDIDVVDIRKIAESARNGSKGSAKELYNKPIGVSFEHKMIYPKTAGQQNLVETLHNKDMIFVSGPAGTGKTFLAVVYAVDKLRNEEVRKIIITRPVVEAGENLGFLPGDLKEKVDPYLRPIYDALHYMFGQIQTERYLERGVIEIAPLAYMRGRTLDDAIIILDEAQNTTTMQMRMFLTRMGFHSKMIITGDTTQVDLPNNKTSGFMDAWNRLKDINEIGFVELGSEDVVRHPLVKKILHKYE